MNKRIGTICLSLLFALFSALSSRAETPRVKPTVSAESAILIEANTGDVVFESNSRKVLPMASTTKIMTALVALENGNLDEKFSVPEEATDVEGSSVYLTAGETVTMRDLLYALMLESANDAATAIAFRIGGSVGGFASLMNEKAEELCLEDTHFTNPHGLDDPEHYTTAYDLCKLTCAAIENAEFEKIVSTLSADAFSCGTRRTLVNHNRLLRSLYGAIGVKTGFTKRSGRCLVSAVRRDCVLTVAVTLNDPNDWSDHSVARIRTVSVSKYSPCGSRKGVGRYPRYRGRNDTSPMFRVRFSVRCFEKRTKSKNYLRSAEIRSRSRTPRRRARKSGVHRRRQNHRFSPFICRNGRQREERKAHIF